MPQKTEPKGRWDYRTGVPGLVRDRNNGRYYARSQVGGKRTMTSLKTSTWSVAKLRGAEHRAGIERQRSRERRVVGGEITMGDLIERHRNEYLADTTKSASSRVNIVATIKRLLTHWSLCFGTELKAMRPGRITIEHARRFANYLHRDAVYLTPRAKTPRTGFKPVTVNKTVELLHRVLRIACEAGIIAGLPFALEPASGPPIRKPEERKKIQLPPSHKMREVFRLLRQMDADTPRPNDSMLEYLRKRAEESADFAEFMAYSGARKSEAAAFRWEDNLPGFIYVRGTKTEHSKDRMVPKIPAMQDLLTRMIERRNKEGRPTGKGPAFIIQECLVALSTACKRAGVQRLTHHSMRHYFATICIESKVDIPTLSRWLGHADGGVLAMQTYGHLRMEHSVSAAQGVTA